jgi:hypothetical protein
MDSFMDAVFILLALISGLGFIAAKLIEWGWIKVS